MSNEFISSREAYTNNELITMIKNKMKNLDIDIDLLYKNYKKYFLSKEELQIVLNEDIYFNYDIYKFIESFLGISIDELTKEVIDDENISARGFIENEEGLMEVLNILFEEMIEHRRYNSIKKVTFEDYLIGQKEVKDFSNNIEECVNYFRKRFNIGLREEDYPLDLFNKIENEQGIYVLRFPNDIGISGLTIVKNSVEVSEKYIGIYVNTNEPVGRQIFTLAHEIYHVLFEKSDELASYEEKRYTNPIEARAEEFASKLVINRYILIKRIKALNKSEVRELNIYDIVKLQKEFGVSFQAIIYVINISGSKDEKYAKYFKQLPKANENFTKSYKSTKYRKYIADKTKKLTNLNQVEDEFILPKLFKSDLEKSLSKDKITRDEYMNILEFFED